MPKRNALLNLLCGYLKKHKDTKSKNLFFSNNGKVIKVYGPRRSFWSFKRDHLATITAISRSSPVVATFHPESALPHQVVLETTIKSFVKEVEIKFS